MTMQSVDQVEQWVGQEVVDRDGERVGKLDEVFYSSISGEAVFGSVKSGLLGRHASLVPLVGASVGREYLRLACSAEEISRASEVDVKDTLDRDSATRAATAYGLVLGEEDYESASVIEQRRRASQQAHENATNLDEQAQRRAAEAHEAQGAARDAELDAEEKSQAAERVRLEAEQAHSNAERLRAP
jgi:hypothetical protein